MFASDVSNHLSLPQSQWPYPAGLSCRAQLYLGEVKRGGMIQCPCCRPTMLNWEWACKNAFHTATQCNKSHHITREGQLSKCPEMLHFCCKSCLNDITRWLVKSWAKRTPPVVWTEIQFKLWHWVSTLQATTPQPEPLFIPKQDRRTFFMTSNHPGVWKVYLVKVDFPPFWHPFCWFS